MPGPVIAEARAGRVFVHTFGCKANQYDSERIERELMVRGWDPGGSPGDADLIVVNTCTVTAEADREAERWVRRAAKRYPGVRVVVVGCAAARSPERFRSLVDPEGVVGGADPEQVASAVSGGQANALVQILDARRGGGSRGPAQGPGLGPPPPRPRRRTRAWLGIQDGCDRRCSFCATRLARGASRSRTADALVEEALACAAHHPEIVLTGIHIGHWGRDLPGGPGLARLLEALLVRVPGPRFRLGSIEASEVDDELLAVLMSGARDGRIAPHLHMPLQSGSDRVLRAMRRWHTRDMYRARALEIAESLPVLGLGADIITGFPGETDADHRDTVRLVEELPFTYLHVFPFSPREGTVAAEMARENPVPQRVAAGRARELRELGVAKGEAYLASRVGAGVEVVVERERPDGTALGLTEDYLRLPVEGERGGGEGPRLHPGRIERDGDRFILRLGGADGSGEARS
jgi:threonylcarbamoyladenosine tRNA methylthiotransferase MtaB